MTFDPSGENPRMFRVLWRHSGGRARLGELCISPSVDITINPPKMVTIPTPNIIVTTKRLCVPHLMPDIFYRTLGEEGLMAGLLLHWESLLEDQAVLLKSSPLSLNRLVGYEESTPVWLATREAEYMSLENQSGIGKKGIDWISVVTEGGVTPMHLRECFKEQVLNRLQPTFAVVPTDIPVMERHPRMKKIRQSTDKSVTYWRIANEAANTLTSAGKKTSSLVPGIVLHSTADNDNSNELSIEMQRRVELVSKETTSPVISLIVDKIDALQHLSEVDSDERAIWLRGPTAPEDLKKCIMAGVDLFESSYATDRATEGIALIFNTNCFDDESNQLCQKLTMADECHFDDFSPLSPDCACIACRGPDCTTRAYIHHLVMSKEMLGLVYLSSHNLWQYANYLLQLRQRYSNRKE